jgi:hypothetical protein
MCRIRNSQRPFLCYVRPPAAFAPGWCGRLVALGILNHAAQLQLQQGCRANWVRAPFQTPAQHGPSLLPVAAGRRGRRAVVAAAGLLLVAPPSPRQDPPDSPGLVAAAVLLLALLAVPGARAVVGQGQGAHPPTTVGALTGTSCSGYRT